MEKLSPKIRRIVALAIDILFAIAIGAIIGTVFKSFLVNHTDVGYYLGFMIAWFYHGLSNSLLKEGQTAGKIITGLKVTDKDGKRIGVIRSLLRSFPIVFCFFGEPPKTSDFYQEILTYLFTPFWVSLVYFSLFYQCCRATHDFLFSTYVIDIKNYKDNFLNKITIKSIVLILLISVSILCWRIFSTSTTIANKTLISNLTKTQEMISQIQGVQNVSVQLEGDKFTIEIITKNDPSQENHLQVQASCLLVKNMALENSNQDIHTVVMRGFDMKIYRSWDISENTLPARNWFVECKK